VRPLQRAVKQTVGKHSREQIRDRVVESADPLDIEEMHTSVATVPAKKEPTFGRSPPPPEAGV
jgi:hypothetical protein